MLRFGPSVLEQRLYLKLENVRHQVDIEGRRVQVSRYVEYKMLTLISELRFGFRYMRGKFALAIVLRDQWRDSFNVSIVECDDASADLVLDLPKRFTILK